MDAIDTISGILQKQAHADPYGVAILAPDRVPLTFDALSGQVEASAARLRALGVSRRDRVAIVLRNGPEMASAFLAVASAATSAPLNPDYRASEFEFYLSDLRASALVIQDDLDSAAREVARALDIPVIELTSSRDVAAGLFSLNGEVGGYVEAGGLAQPRDVALVLHTSGTTSRPKLVPLTHTNVCASVGHIASTLALTERDRCLNVMPLFHIHGLMAAVLASLAAGGSVVCTSGFTTRGFFDALAAFTPTWYSAVPTIHQAVLAAVAQHRDAAANSSLRFIRSSSSSLPPQVMQALELAFRVPVIESYGMTEAAHQMASNPLPPAVRKPSTVGRAAGPEIDIMDESGRLLTAGEAGEIVIRGANVTEGYDNNPSANEAAFTDGWFRTGDLGVLDADGYLKIVGRLKEIVNRGGKKIAPREVDEVLLDHPDVAQAIAFAVPHTTLGEDLAAAIVLRGPSAVTEGDLRRFAFTRLADYKVPSQILLLDDIPKGPTGKPQRIGLAEKLASYLKPGYAPPRNPREEALARIWAEVLQIDRVGVDDNFFTLGGDSLLAASAMLEVEKRLGGTFDASILFHAPTVAQLAARLGAERIDSVGFATPLKTGDQRTPLFCIPGHGGDIFTFRELANHLWPERPVYAFRFPDEAARDDSVANAMVEKLGATYVAEMLTLQPSGPYLLCGFCYGGEVAFEMAHQLRARGHTVGFVAIIYAYQWGSIRSARLLKRVRYHFGKIRQLGLGDQLEYIGTRAVKRLRSVWRQVHPPGRLPVELSTANPWVPRFYPGRITLLRPTDGEEGNLEYDPQMGWGPLAGELAAYDVPGDKHSVFNQPHVASLAATVSRCLDAADAGGVQELR